MKASATINRLVAALAVLVGGLVHLQLYFDGYRSAPDANLGRSFIANGVASVVIAAALVVRSDKVVRLAGIALALGTLVAFAMSRRGGGIFGLRESGLQPSPHALIALIAEIAIVVLLGISLLPAVGGGDSLDKRVGLGAATAFGAAAVVLAALWAQESDDGGSAIDVTPASVAISDFAFVAPEITVATGAEVTWTNSDSFAHSVVATDGSFRSESLGNGESFSTTFGAPGTFDYVCGIHPSMAGTVVVTD